MEKIFGKHCSFHSRFFFQGQDSSDRYFDGVLNPILIILSPFALMNKSDYRDKLCFMSFAVFFIFIAFFLGEIKDTLYIACHPCSIHPDSYGVNEYLDMDDEPLHSLRKSFSGLSLFFFYCYDEQECLLY